MSGPPWLVVGCGYVGSHLARALVARGTRVTVARRDRAAAEALAHELGPLATAARIDLAEPAALRASPETIVACLAPPGADPAAELRALAAAPAARLLYVSSTGVYAPGGGAWVDEDWPLAPTSAAGRARVIAEAALAAARPDALALRAAGIYGPGRGLAQRIRAGTYRVVGDGRAHVSRIHVEDLVALLLLAAAAPHVRGALNAADDDPAPIGLVADAVAARLGLPPPPRVAAADVPRETAAMLTADRRIANARAKAALGFAPRYPSWRDALDA